MTTQLSLAFLLCLSAGSLAATDNSVRVQFREVDTLFANPGQGWMSQQRSPRGAPRFPCSVVYIRFNWADVEPEEGQYNWKLIDDMIAAWKPSSAGVSMRVMTANAHSSGYYTSPKWLFDAGCKSHGYLRGDDPPVAQTHPTHRTERRSHLPENTCSSRPLASATTQRGRESLDIRFLGIWGEWRINPRQSRCGNNCRSLPARLPQDAACLHVRRRRSDYALARCGHRRDGVGSPCTNRIITEEIRRQG